jgi:hypothetical protein
VIADLWIGGCGFGDLVIEDCHCGLLPRQIAIANSESTIAFTQSPIDNRIQSISQSPIANPHSVNQQSAIANPQFPRGFQLY